MSIHIGAKKGEIAETILLPGDPLRAKHIAEKYLKDAVCYNTVRNMFGYTGLYNGQRVSVQGTGMGGPSASIYIHELINDFGVKQLVRIGTAGSYQPDINIRDIVVVLSASTNAAVNRTRFHGADYAACPDFQLLQRALAVASAKNIPIKAGNVLSSDQFYVDDPDGWKLWAAFGVLAVEMETSALYTIAAQFRVKALSLLTISDSLVTGESCSSTERETSFDQMTEIALELI